MSDASAATAAATDAATDAAIAALLRERAMARAQEQKHLHSWVEAQHHPVVEILSHISSPLSGALLIFGVHKAWQMPAMRAHFHSLSILRRAARRSNAPKAASRPQQPQTPNPTTAARPPQQQQRAMHAFASQQRARHPQPIAFGGLSGRWFSSVAAAAAAANSGARAAPPPAVARLHFDTPSLPSMALRRAVMQRTGMFARVTLREQSTIAAAAAAVVPSSSSSSIAAATAASSAAAQGSPSALNATLEASALATSLPDLGASMTPRIRKLLELYDPADVSDVVQHMQDMWSVRMAESALEWIHTTLGLPWWACIVSLTVGLRTAIIPANISLLRNSMRMKLVLPRIAELDAIMRDDKSTPEQREEAAQELQKLFKERDCHPMRNFVIPLGFPPIILSIFLAIHNLTIGEPAMATEGVLWFRDLVEPDPSYLLPILSSVSWLLMVELASGAYYHAWPHVRATARVTSLAFIPLTTTLPAGVFLFWITSNLFAITRTLVLRRDDVRRKLNIPLISDIRDLDHIPAPKP